MLGAWKARVAPFNVNYRYVAEELRYLLDDAGATGDRRAVALRPDARRGAARRCPACDVIIQVPDALGHDLLPGAVWYDDALAGVAGAARRTSPAAPTTSTSSTPAGRPGCPRACCGATATP